MKGKNNKYWGGFTLVEVIIGAAIFVVIAMSVYQAFVIVMDIIRASKEKITATALGNEQFEIIRNLPYADVGIINGLPAGKIPANQNLVRNNLDFIIKTTIRNIDDPFDGTIGGAQNDLSPADYKLVELGISCPTCHRFPNLSLTTFISPKNLESASTNGALLLPPIFPQKI